MKNKKALIVALFVLSTLCLVASGCVSHQHQFDAQWHSDADAHWHQCSCGEVSEVASHIVTEWTVEKPATSTEVGYKCGTCVVCGATVRKELAVEQHTHVYGEEWFSDESQHWKQCSCGETILCAEHTVYNWIIDIPAEENVVGSKHGDCGVCGRPIQMEIPMTNHTHDFGGWKSSTNYHWRECPCGETDYWEVHIPSDWVVETPATSTEAGSKYKYCTVCYCIVERQEIEAYGNLRTVNFYAINDFHGAVENMPSVAGYLTQVKNQNENSVIINSGDMFQGSMESNSNYGQLLSDCMDDVGFDAFVFGNHEFDWGLEKLGALSNSASTPFLGANIYHWNAQDKTWGTFADELAQEYTIKTLPNGLKIGIIGVIGKDQITSISSNLVQTIGFKNPAEVIPALSVKLKTQLGCDIVAVSAHTGQATFLNDNNFDITQYADVVFCAHTHSEETTIKNGVPFIQGGSYGQYVSNVTLVVDNNGNVSCENNTNIARNYSWPNKFSVSQLIDNSNEKISVEANQVLAELSGNLDAYTGIPRLVSHAIADYATQFYDDLDLAMVNQGRRMMYGGNVTYSDLYTSVPFDNQVYIAVVSGADIIKEASYSGNEVWRISGQAIENSNYKYYKIAVIDYLLFHQNSNRDYNYFPSAFTSEFQPVALENSNYDVYNYRLITRDFLLKNNTINAAAYNNANEHTDKGLLSANVDLTEPIIIPTAQHSGTVSDPYTVSDALIVAAGSTDRATAPVGYVLGTVCGLEYAELASNTGDMYNLYISDESGAKICVYYLKKFEGATQAQNWKSVSELQEGDTLLIYASIFTYISSSGTEKPELYSGYLVELNGAEVS